MERAERAVVSLARHRSAPDVFAMLWRYGSRDYRNIGHKAIFVANTYRTLQAVGWQYAEPVLRSLVLGLLAFGKEEQVNGYAFTDQCYTGNLELLQKMVPRTADNWAAEPSDAAAARSILSSLRDGTPQEACADIAARLAKNSASAATVWDAVHLASAELSMRVRGAAGIVGIHAVTAANALHYAYLSAADRQERLLMMLQAAGWAVQFRKWAESREDNLRRFEIINIQAAGEDAKEDVFSTPTLRHGRICCTGLPSRSRSFRPASLHFRRSSADYSEGGRSSLLQVPRRSHRRHRASQPRVAAASYCSDALLHETKRRSGAGGRQTRSAGGEGASCLK
jgi:hypothetical protein